MKDSFKEELDKSRKEINEIDKNLVDLLNKRAEIVMKIKRTAMCRYTMQKGKRN